MKRVLESGFKPRMLIYAGSFKPRWAVDLLPYILRRVVDKKPDTLLLLAGYGKLSILKNFDELGVTNNVKLVGEVSHNHLADVFAIADIGLATYTTSSAAYGVPLKIKEYMAAGLPVVASDFRSIAKFINEAKAGAVASADAEGLAKVTLNLLSLSRRKYIELSTRATEYVRSYDWRNLLKRYESLLVRN
jgi:glycosyltransferase involved in cell wall biosynthesis